MDVHGVCGLWSRVWGRLGVQAHGARVGGNHWVPASVLGAAQEAGQCPQQAQRCSMAASEASWAGLAVVAKGPVHLLRL